MLATKQGVCATCQSTPCPESHVRNKHSRLTSDKRTSLVDLNDNGLTTHWQRRVAIGCHCFQMGAPSRSEWHGRGGTICQMRAIVGLPHSSSNQRLVLDALVEALCCVQNNVDYNDIDRQSCVPKGGQSVQQIWLTRAGCGALGDHTDF
jgi:hypothetical protein